MSGKGKIKNIQQFLTAEPQERLGMRKKGMASFSDEQVADVDRMASILPRIQLEVKAGVVALQGEDKEAMPEEWEEDISTADLLTIACKINRLHVKPGEKRSQSTLPTCRTRSPRRGTFSSAAQMAPACLRLRRLTLTIGRWCTFPISHSQRWRAQLHYHSKSTGIMGLDMAHPVKVTIIPEDKVARKYEMHPEDKALDLEKSLFEEAFGMMDEGDSDTDDEADETK